MDKIVNNTDFIIDIPDYEGIGVYALINNRSQKMYIGSSQNVKKRIKQHSLSPISAMRDDIRNGDTFSVKILEMLQYGCNQFDLFERESYFIQKHNALSEGYNQAKTTCCTKEELLHSLEGYRENSEMREYIKNIIHKREKPIYAKVCNTTRKISIEDSLFAEVQKYATKAGMSLNKYIIQAIEEKISHDNGRQ